MGSAAEEGAPDRDFFDRNQDVVIRRS